MVGGDFGLGHLYMRYVHRRPRTFHVAMIRGLAALTVALAALPVGAPGRGFHCVLELATLGGFDAGLWIAFFAALAASQACLSLRTPNGDVYAAFAQFSCVGLGIAATLHEDSGLLAGAVRTSTFSTIASVVAFFLPAVSTVFYISLFQVTWPVGVEHQGWLRRLAESGKNRRVLREFAAKYQARLETGSGTRDASVRGTYRWHPVDIRSVSVALSGTSAGMTQSFASIRVEFPKLDLPPCRFVKSGAMRSEGTAGLPEARGQAGNDRSPPSRPGSPAGELDKIRLVWLQEQAAFDKLFGRRAKSSLFLSGQGMTYGFPYHFWHGFGFSLADVEAVLDAMIRFGEAIERALSAEAQEGEQRHR